MVTLDAIRQKGYAAIYPRQVLEGCESALVLFAAGFLGKQDAIWIADAGLTATCVDVDAGRLGEMEAVYPEGWEFVTADVFAYAMTTDRQWDVLSIDPPTNLFEQCAAWLPRWCELARRAVILGCGESTDILPPSGWQLNDMLYRSSFQGGVYWAVLEKAS